MLSTCNLFLYNLGFFFFFFGGGGGGGLKIVFCRLDLELGTSDLCEDGKIEFHQLVWWDNWG